jgi:hypothetical protein
MEKGALPVVYPYNLFRGKLVIIKAERNGFL